MNILIIRMHRIGDILQLTPMLQGLKKRYPDCRIFFFTGDEMSHLLEGNPDVDEIITIPEKKYRYYLKNKPEYYASIYNDLYELISGLKENRFQTIINRHYEFGGILAYLIGAEQIIGKTLSPDGGFFLSDQISSQLYDAILTNRKANRRNLVDWSCHIAGLRPGCGKMYFAVPEIALWQAECLLSEFSANNDPFIAVQMGAAKSFRQWGVDNYFQVIQWLIEEKGKKVVLLGTTDEKGDAEIIHSRLGRSNQGLVDLTGKTDLKTLGAVLRKCQILITGDTGTMHMATAVGTQVIALFYGTAFPWETGPYGTGHLVLYADMECAPCFHPEDCNANHECRKAITPEHVSRAFEITEALRENRITDSNVTFEKVKLYLTYAEPGTDQMLMEINAISTIRNFQSSSHHSGIADIKGEGIFGNMDSFIHTGNRLLQKLYCGNSEGFMDLFPEYVSLWIKLLSYVKEMHLDQNTSEALLQCLYPAVNEATRAMEAEDYAALSDLIQYNLKHAIAILTNASPNNTYECERKMMQ